MTTQWKLRISYSFSSWKKKNGEKVYQTILHEKQDKRISKSYFTYKILICATCWHCFWEMLSLWQKVDPLRSGCRREHCVDQGWHQNVSRNWYDLKGRLTVSLKCLWDSIVVLTQMIIRSITKALYGPSCGSSESMVKIRHRFCNNPVQPKSRT